MGDAAPAQPLNLENLSKQLESLPLWGKTLVAGGVALAVYLPYSWYRSKPRATPIKKDFQPGIVYLFQFPRSKNVPSISASCLRLETWLRIADVPYENMEVPLTTRGLDGAMPFIEIDGQEFSHSSVAINELKRRLSRDSLEEHMSEEQKAASAAFERLAQLSLSTSHLIYRAENADKVISLIPSQVSGFFAPLVSQFVQHAYLGRCAAAVSSSGFGRYSREQRIGMGEDDLRALSKYLGAKHYFTGFKPTTVDATLFGVLAQIAYAPYESSHGELLKGECSNLFDFCERIKTRFWPDWNEATTAFSTDSNWKKKHGSPRSSARTSPMPKNGAGAY